MGQTFYISDLHFGHENILAFDHRPFVNMVEHDEELIRRWNNAVGIDDDVWILGDISWYNPQRTVTIFDSLNGIKHLCVGNHDKKLLKSKNVRDLFVEVVDYKEIEMDNGKGIVLCHYPIPCFKNHYHGWYHLYGHVHSSFEHNMMCHVKFEMQKLYNTDCNMYNVGCMMPYMQYAPQTLADIIKKSNQDPFVVCVDESDVKPI